MKPKLFSALRKRDAQANCGGRRRVCASATPPRGRRAKATRRKWPGEIEGCSGERLQEWERLEQEKRRLEEAALARRRRDEEEEIARLRRIKEAEEERERQRLAAERERLAEIERQQKEVRPAAAQRRALLIVSLSARAHRNRAD